MVSAVVYNNGASMHQYKEMQTLSVQTSEAKRPACQHRAPATSALANATWQRAGRCSGTRIISGPHLRPSPNHPAAEPHFPWWRFFVSRPITRLCCWMRRAFPAAICTPRATIRGLGQQIRATGSLGAQTGVNISPGPQICDQSWCTNLRPWSSLH